jgi:DNA polymerase-4
MSQAAYRKIIHVNMDAFYASVEQRDHPTLQGRPVARRLCGKARGCSRGELRGTRLWRAIGDAVEQSNAQMPDLVFVPPRFEVYRTVSHQIRSIFADYTVLIEPLSLDEAYLDVTENLRGISTASATAADIRARIFDETGLTASAGISYNKFLAKLASDRHKPNGQFVILPNMGAAFIEALPVGKFHGVGRSLPIR